MRARRAVEAIDHGNGPVPVHVDRRSTGLARRLQRRLRAGERECEERRIRHGTVHRRDGWRRAAATAHDGATRFVAAMVARRHSPRVHARTRTRRQTSAATALSSVDARRRAGTTDGSAERRGRPEMVSGWHAHRLQERDVPRIFNRARRASRSARPRTPTTDVWTRRVNPTCGRLRARSTGRMTTGIWIRPAQRTSGSSRHRLRRRTRARRSR